MEVVQLHFENQTDKPSLGDWNVVSRLVTDFGQAVIAVRNDFLSGKPGTDDPVLRIERLAAKAGDVIMGRSPEYHAEPWNNPVRLGSKIRYLCDEIRQYPDPGQAFFVWLSKQVVASMVAVEEQRMSDEVAGKKLREVLDSAVDTLVGVR